MVVDSKTAPLSGSAMEALGVAIALVNFTKAMDKIMSSVDEMIEDISANGHDVEEHPASFVSSDELQELCALWTKYISSRTALYGEMPLNLDELQGYVGSNRRQGP